MQFLKTIWDFFQHQILAMQWLNELLGRVLTAFGLDTTNRWAGSLQFFSLRRGQNYGCCSVR